MGLFDSVPQKGVYGDLNFRTPKQWAEDTNTQLQNTTGQDAYKAYLQVKQTNPELAGVYLKEAQDKMRQSAIDWNPMGVGMTVWHGSPHKFNKFDMSKIGTGEGAQAYGHGLYFAEAPNTAIEYQKTLSGDGFIVGDKVFDPSTLQHMNVRSISRGGDVDAAIAKASEVANSNSPVANLAAQDLAVLQEIKAAGGMQPNTGALYKTDIPDEAVTKMLDWDKPLSEQQIPPLILAIAKKGYNADPKTVEQLLMGLEKELGPQGYNSLLNKAGIPGIRYFDEGSRSGGRMLGVGKVEGNNVVFTGYPTAWNYATPELAQKALDSARAKLSSNFVVFDDNMPRILEVNGVPTGNKAWTPGEYEKINYSDPFGDTTR